MKMNKWTVGLAAAGMISLASVAQAQDGGTLSTPKLGTSTLTGYVSTSYHWAIGKDPSQTSTQQDAREDRFSVDVVSLTLASAKTEGDWGAGYNVQMWLGKDADNLNLGGGGGEGNELKNAYLSLNLPIGDGVNLDFGRFDTILGYETIDVNTNAHYTHSGGYAIEPTLHEGLKAQYQVSDNVGVQLLMANTIDATADSASGNTQRKTYGFALNMSAPDSFGTLGGSTLDIAWINGDENGQTASGSVSNYYMGLTVPTGIDKLSAGLAWDVREAEGGKGQSDSSVALYFQYAVSDQTTLNVRGERINDGPSANEGTDSWDLTTTVTYQLWDGVMSRLEYRLTTLDDVTGTQQENSHSVWANMIYEF